MPGNKHCETMCSDGVTRLSHIRGRMQKAVWIIVGDITLVSPHNFQDAKADIFPKYTSHEVRRLKDYGELVQDLARLDVDQWEGLM